MWALRARFGMATSLRFWSLFEWQTTRCSVMPVTDPGSPSCTRSRNRGVFALTVDRIKDWLNGVRQAQPDRDTQRCLSTEPLTDAERFRLVYQMVTAPPEEGGADITPKHGKWQNVECVFPLHDHVRNKRWLDEWSRKTILSPEDLDHIRDSFGEKVGK